MTVGVCILVISCWFCFVFLLFKLLLNAGVIISCCLLLIVVLCFILLIKRFCIVFKYVVA